LMNSAKSLFLLVGAAGFELATLCSQSRCALPTARVPERGAQGPLTPRLDLLVGQCAKADRRHNLRLRPETIGVAHRRLPPEAQGELSGPPGDLDLAVPRVLEHFLRTDRRTPGGPAPITAGTPSAGSPRRLARWRASATGPTGGQAGLKFSVGDGGGPFFWSSSIMPLA